MTKTAGQTTWCVGNTHSAEGGASNNETWGAQQCGRNGIRRGDPGFLKRDQSADGSAGAGVGVKGLWSFGGSSGPQGRGVRLSTTAGRSLR